MEIITQLDGEEMRIELRGRLDAAWSNSVNKTLQETVHGGCHRIALDLAQVSYISSAGIRVLVMLAKSLSGIGGQLRLSDASPAVKEVLTLVGFQKLLDTFSAPASMPVTPPVANTPRVPKPVTMTLADITFDVYTLAAEAVQQGQVVNNPPDKTVPIAVDAQSWVIGQGMLGAQAQTERYGELLAVAGLAISLPGDDPAHPDWLQQEGDLVPTVSLCHGLSVTGPFRHLLRFGNLPETLPLRLSELAQAAITVCGSDTVSWVMVAETAHLIGAALQVPAANADDGLFAFPGIRDRLLFTAEPAYTDETCLIAGVISRQPSSVLASQVRPDAADGLLYSHCHAAIVPFDPVHKGFIELPESLARLMDSQTLRGVLHLLNDDREGVGAGESFLRRGAIWCAPVNFTGEVSA